MKTLINKSILLEVSQRELEMIALACEAYSNFWKQRSRETLDWDQVMKDTRMEVAINYQKIADEAREILGDLPF